MTTPSNDEPLVTPLPAPYGPAVVDAVAIDEVARHAGDDLPKVNARYIWFMVLAQFGVFMAFITPLAISLSIKVNSLARGTRSTSATSPARAPCSSCSPPRSWASGATAPAPGSAGAGRSWWAA